MIITFNILDNVPIDDMILLLLFIEYTSNKHDYITCVNVLAKHNGV